jgi:2-aminoadipate transaminase
VPSEQRPPIGSQQPHSPLSPRPSRVDPYLERYATRARGMVASEIRALFAVAARPEVVSLAGGMPYISALPLDAVGELAGQLVADRGAVALQYGSGQGDPGLREGICDVMALEGIKAHPDEIVVTIGSQQALDLLTRIFVDPGDVVLAEGPSYVGALGTFASYEAAVVHVPMDERGLIPEALAYAISRLAAEGRRPKFLYTCPSFHNPAGVTLDQPRRAMVLEVCQRAGLPVIEDNPYGLLGFDGEPARALRANDPDGVIYLGTFSKTIAPGLRVGWALAPSGVRDKLILAAESAVLCHSSLAQLMVREYLATQPWREQVKVFRELYRERRDAMLDALGASMPVGCRWTSPSGGFYVWLGLPPGIDAKAMLPRAIAARVAYVPGTGFYTGGQGGDHLRLSYCFPQPSRIREGVRRLAEVIAAEVDLRSTFSSPASSADPARSIGPAGPGGPAGPAGWSGGARGNPDAAAADPVQ